MTEPAIQDHYPDDLSHCYGCGRLNPHGHQIKSRWDGNETVALFRPEPHHTAIPGFVYGGLIASLVDCHGTATASAATCRAEGRPLGSDPPARFVTASLHVDFLRPTPLEGTLEVRGRVADPVRPGPYDRRGPRSPNGSLPFCEEGRHHDRSQSTGHPAGSPLFLLRTLRQAPRLESRRP